MSYKLAMDGLADYRASHIASLLGEKASSWFAAGFSSIKNMLSSLSSDNENKKVAEIYATGKPNERVPAHMRLDYVCGMRREIRKQYISGESGIYTDVTPFRHGVMSAHGATLFDDAMNQVISRKAGT